MVSPEPVTAGDRQWVTACILTPFIVGPWLGGCGTKTPKLRTEQNSTARPGPFLPHTSTPAGRGHGGAQQPRPPEPPPSGNCP